MRGVLKIVLVFLILLAVLGFVAYHFFGIPGAIGYIIFLIALVFLGKKLAGAAFVKLLTVPFQMKGAVLRGAKVRVHQVTEASGPVKRVPLGQVQDEQELRDESERRANMRYFVVEVTITPPGEDSGAFKAWEPGSLCLVPVGTSKKDIQKLSEDQQATVESFDLWEGTRFLHNDDDSADKLEGEQRLRLLFAAGKNLTKVKFQYYFEFFGELDLPAATGAPLAAAPVAPSVSVSRITPQFESPGAIPIDLSPQLPVNRAAVAAAGKLTTRLRDEGELIGVPSDDAPLYKISAAKVEGEDHLPDPPGQLREEDLVTPIKVGASNVKKLTQALNLTPLEPIPQLGQANVAAALATKVAEQKKSTQHLKWLSATAQQLEEEEAAAAEGRRDPGISPPEGGATQGPQKPRMTTRTIIPPAPKANASLIAAAARSAAELQNRPAPPPQPVLIEDEPAPAVHDETPVPAPDPEPAPAPASLLPEVPAPKPQSGPVGTAALPDVPGGASSAPVLESRPRVAPKPGVIQAAPSRSTPNVSATPSVGAYGLPKLDVDDLPATPVQEPEPEPAPLQAAEATPQPAVAEQSPVVEEAEEVIPSVLFAETAPENVDTPNTFAGPDIDLEELAAAATADTGGEFVLPPGAKVSAEEMRVPAYYLVVNGPPEGPYSLENLFNRLADGSLQLTDFTWKEGMPEWISIESVLSEITE